jgi:ubiquinone/menaquinone biosynthesis C-methylase UbiE
MKTNEIKQAAIDVHSRKAGAFAASYEDMTQDAYANAFVYSRKRLAKLLDQYLPTNGEGKRALDVGCGPGIYMGLLAERGFATVGVDGSPEMLALARSNNPGAELHQSDVETLPIASSSVDLVLCIEVLRYLPDPSIAIREIGRVLKPGGVCLATASPAFSLNGYLLVNRVVEKVPMFGLQTIRQFFTTSGELRSQFGGAGFADVDVHGVYTGALNWVERLAPRALRTYLKAWEPVDERLSDGPILRELSNMYLVHAVRG